jgi:hypothetical protein
MLYLPPELYIYLPCRRRNVGQLLFARGLFGVTSVNLQVLVNKSKKYYLARCQRYLLACSGRA